MQGFWDFGGVLTLLGLSSACWLCLLFIQICHNHWGNRHCHKKIKVNVKEAK